MDSTNVMKKRGTMRMFLFILFCCIYILSTLFYMDFINIFFMWAFNFLKSTSKLSLADLFIHCPDAVLAQGCVCRDLGRVLPQTNLFQIYWHWILHHGYVPDKIIFPYAVIVLSLSCPGCTRAYWAGRHCNLFKRISLVMNCQKGSCVMKGESSEVLLGSLVFQFFLGMQESVPGKFCYRTGEGYLARKLIFMLK